MTAAQWFLAGMLTVIGLGNFLILGAINGRVSKIERDLKWRGVL